MLPFLDADWRLRLYQLPFQLPSGSHTGVSSRTAIQAQDQAQSQGEETSVTTSPAHLTTGFAFFNIYGGERRALPAYLRNQRTAT